MATQPSKTDTPKNTDKPAEPSKAAGFVAPDWERIELDYRAGIKTLRQIADENGICHASVVKRAKRDGWPRFDRPSKKEPVRLVEVDELNKAGFVYVIYLEDSSKERFYKIGMAVSFSARFDTHQCASPFNLFVACSYFTGNMRAEERALHQNFSEKRVRGEWFRLDDADLEFIAKRSKLV